jgi:hypothetical protein
VSPSRVDPSPYTQILDQAGSLFCLFVVDESFIRPAPEVELVDVVELHEDDGREDEDGGGDLRSILQNLFFFVTVIVG